MVKTLQAGLQNSEKMTQLIIEHLLLMMWKTDLPSNRIFALLQTVEYDIACMTKYL